MENTDLERKRFPKQAFDSEYMTEFLREVRFLTEKGIKYTFVRKTPEYGISQFKYKKTPELFAALVEFYATLNAERAVRRGGLVREMKVSEPSHEIILSPEQVKQMQVILEAAAKQNQEENKDDTV